jgi:2'-5' RNA ligase
MIGPLADAIVACAREQTSFEARARGFGSFAERTLFARIEPDEKWSLLRNALYDRLAAALPDLLRKDARPFVPHLTIANRDIPAGAVAPALRYLGEIALDEGFPANNLTLFERKDGVWVPAMTELLPTPRRE